MPLTRRRPICAPRRAWAPDFISLIVVLLLPMCPFQGVEHVVHGAAGLFRAKVHLEPPLAMCSSFVLDDELLF